MSIFLFLSLCFLCVLSYFFCGKKISSPSVIVNFSFLLSSCFVCVYEDYWELTMSSDAVFLILACLVIFLVGNTTMYRLCSFNHKERFNIEKKEFSYPNVIVIVTIFIGILIAYQFYQSVFSMIDTLNLDYTQQFLQAREDSLLYGWDIPNWMKFGLSLVNCMAFVSVYCIVYNTCTRGFVKQDIKLMIPIFIFVVITIVKMARIDLLQLFLYSAYLYILLTSILREDYSIKRQIQYLLFTGIIFMVLFCSLRYLRGGEYDIILHIARYFGGPLLCFSMYLDHTAYPFYYTPSLGWNTFRSLYLDIIRLTSNDVPTLMSTDGIPVYGYDFTCNVYTALAVYYEDFGYIGCIFAFLFLSLIFTIFHTYIIKNKISGVLLIIYADISTSLFMLPISEIFFSNQIQFSRIGHFLLIFLLMKLCIKKRILFDK